MNTHATFEHPAELVTLSPDDAVLAAAGAAWFVELLKAIPEVEVEPELCQEDWGVVVFLRRGGTRFWVGLSVWPEEEQMWLAHFHQRGLLQRLGSSGKRELQRLLQDAQTVLSADPSVSRLTWDDGNQVIGSDNKGR